ncbi:MAG: hypothetical protein F8N15_07755 [Methanobacterium sp.]|nr:hypothetical protein [Methanobacterium sp.]
MNICIDKVKIKKDEQTMLIYRKDGFEVMGSTTTGNGSGHVNSIVYHGMDNQKHPVPYNDDEIEEYERIMERNEYLSTVLDFKGVKEPAASILLPLNNFEFEICSGTDFTVLVSAVQDSSLFLNILVFVDHELNPKTMVKMYKSIIESKIAALWDLGVINHFSFDPMDTEDDESILIAAKGSSKEFDYKLDHEIISKVQHSVRETVKTALINEGFPKGVIEFMRDVGVEVDDLVDAGMELIVGVDETTELREKLKAQIYHSLEDLNVVSFIVAGIRLEEDYEKHRVRGVDVDDDPAYLYSDEVFGMSVANQIAGTKAIFNFKRYDEAKPGIISKLGPVLDDIFAGVVAGCMSKIFEV